MHTQLEVFPYGIKVGGTLTKTVDRREPQDVEYAATLTPDITRGGLFRYTLEGDVTIANPTGLATSEGVEFVIQITQDDPGGRAVTWGAAYEFGPAGPPAFTDDAADAVSVVRCFVVADDKILCSVVRGDDAAADGAEFGDVTLGDVTAGDVTADAVTVDTVNGVTILTGAADPTAGAGVAGTMPAMYFRTTGGAGTAYIKTGAADTAWGLITTT